MRSSKAKSAAHLTAPKKKPIKDQTTPDAKAQSTSEKAPKKKAKAPYTWDTVIEGKTLREWEELWVPVSDKNSDLHPELNGKVGLYRASLNGGIMAIGRAIELPQGLSKRVRDFSRDSDSSRKHPTGIKINENLDDLVFEVLVTGTDRRGGNIAAKLKPPMIAVLKPSWTVASRFYDSPTEGMPDDGLDI